MRIGCNNLNIAFRSNLTFDFYKKVQETDIKQTEKELDKFQIYAKFDDSKEVAACTLQTVKIFKALNIPLPISVQVTDFNKNEWVSNLHGTADTLGNIRFNKSTFNDIEFFDYIATKARERHLIPTGHFLGVFLHEFSHIANFTNMKGRKTKALQVEDFKQVNVPLKMQDYILNTDGYYLPNKNLAELFAYTMEKRLGESLDEDTFLPHNNPFQELYIREYSKISDAKFNRILKSIYEGNIEDAKSHLRYFC